ncbi:hypothetical protein EPD83_004695 [Phycicoccus sp. CMS6Z-2]|uniref:PABS domain-containing protein n=2 Tax=Phycicoccus flavus TaxID=2502783 RepID=A0A8T6QZH0_9MICO|nr:hypothetical protein [Phycicoccus flavus]
MDSLDPSTERDLATQALARHDRPRTVLVGGLGLGFTTRAVLADPRVEHVDVVELSAPLVRWARAGLVAELAGLEEERCRLHVADVADVLTGGHEPPGPWDLVLLDVDNGPGFLVHAENADLYRVPGLARARDALEPGGVLVVWSSHVAPDLHAHLQDVAAPGETVAEVPIRVRRDGRSFTYALYVLHRGAAA